MSEQNVARVREAFELLAKGELLWDILDEHVVIQDHDIPDTRDYRGHEGFLRWMEDWSEPWAEWSADPAAPIEHHG